MARKLRIAVGLAFLAIFLTSVVAAPLAVAKSSSPERLRCRIVKRTPKYLLAKHSHPLLRLVLRHGQDEVTLPRAGHFHVVRVTSRYVVLRAARPQAVKGLSVTAPTGTGSYAVGADLTVKWTTSKAITAGEFGVWARSAGGSTYGAKLVNAQGKSYATGLTLDVPLGTGYQAIVAYRPRAGSGSWSSFATSPGTFSVVATPTPPPSVVSVGLILQPADLVAIRARVAAGTQPWAGAWSILSSRVDGYLTSKPNLPATSPLRGPVDLDGVLRPYMDRLSGDGAKVRDLSIAYAVSQKADYLAKARELLLAWVRGYTPTTYQDCPMLDTGQLQAYGAFSMAYGYDYMKSALTASERAEARAWFARLADAEQTTFVSEYGRLAWEKTKTPYEWSIGGKTLYYNAKERIIGGDFAMLISNAVLACSYESEQRANLIRAIYDPSNVFRVSEMVRHCTAPTNDGDYVPAHGVPVPMMYICKNRVVGRGGMIDYGTYNTRLANALLEMGPAMRAVVPTADVVADHYQSLAASWDYLARFFGPGAEPSPNPNDVVDRAACLNRFVLALHDVPSDRVRNAVLSGNLSWYNESQLLGPVTLTHYPLP